MSIDKKSKHYDHGGIEVMAFIKAKLTPEQYKGYLLGNQIKYHGRANFKDDFFRDVEKAGIYNKLLLELKDEVCDKCKDFVQSVNHNYCSKCGKLLPKI